MWHRRSASGFIPIPAADLRAVAWEALAEEIAEEEADEDDGDGDGDVDEVAEMDARQKAMLREISAMGMDLMRATHRRAMAEAAGEVRAADGEDAPPPPPGAGLVLRGDPGLVFSRLGRTVREAMVLERRIVEGPPERPEPGRPGAGAAGNAPQDEVLTPERRAKILARITLLYTRAGAVVDAVRDTLRAAGREEGPVESFTAALHERMVDRERFECLNEPVGAIIARICGELGLTPDWSRWTGEAWAIEEAADQPHGSPYSPGGTAVDWHTPRWRRAPEGGDSS